MVRNSDTSIMSRMGPSVVLTAAGMHSGHGTYASMKDTISIAKAGAKT
eukprot:CAMPEP_0174310462 /NCGR_PEP_ID=MMETSP0810-20121108/3062_1 /TAXON_ID=73025 ORGANISM="Eutreptiella gymnastica-like, Strain CCMP1594" /NCGR_SAMPLE_ID=MMETSP0810 /ASSEMBLY_ACC=CAM_ASM_000659 /LENGTH=47 /DNA_ID= /DNA_START= /DNA_END= /DNA_ORIENTATION=